MPSIASLLKTTARGIGRLPRLIGDAYNPPPVSVRTPPFISEEISSDPDESVGIYALPDGTVLPPFTPPAGPAAEKPSRWRPLIGDVLAGSLAGLGTSNVAFGGPTDVGRAALIGMETVRQRNDAARARGIQEQAAAANAARQAREAALLPARQRLLDAQRQAAEAQAAQRQAAASRSQTGQPIPIGQYGYIDPATGQHIMPPQPEQPKVTVSADFARRAGLVVPEGAATIDVPETVYRGMVSPVMSAQKPSSAEQQLRARRQQLISGYTAQGVPEEEAEGLADRTLAEEIAMGPAVARARMGSLSAGAANAQVRSAATSQAAAAKAHRERIAQMANRVLAEDTSGAPENAIKNVLNPEYYVNLTPQERYDVAAEIKRRTEKPAQRSAGGPLQAIIGRHTAVPGATQPSRPQPGQPQQPAPQLSSRPAAEPPAEMVQQMQPGQRIQGPDGSIWQKQADGRMKRVQ